MKKFLFRDAPHPTQSRFVVYHELCKPVLAEIDVDRTHSIKPRPTRADPIIPMVSDTRIQHLLFDFANPASFHYIPSIAAPPKLHRFI
ncbi:hypothetical protein [Burkholderia gladioli]|uniref:hypothetical protein n=1 Tax=Burkholderia gladioli TaxID=28095 RepID=UPI001640EF78|nr:hypothetical protein [Burkholderia gladioli]